LPGRLSQLFKRPGRLGLAVALAVAVMCDQVLLLVFMAMQHWYGTTFQQFGGATPFITLAGFVFTVIQLNNSNVEARASFAQARASLLKAYTADFLRPDLFGTWHDLIYGYSNTIYAAVDAYVLKHHAYPNYVVVPGQPAVSWRPAFWHPSLFQATAEERRIDALLGYFEILGYHKRQALIDVGDISGLIGEFLQDIRSRTMIYDYFVVMWRAWDNDQWKDPLRSDRSELPQFYDFVRLLAALPSRSPKRRVDARIETDDALKHWKETSPWHTELLRAFRPGTY
jgi:hypothetical protein